MHQFGHVDGTLINGRAFFRYFAILELNTIVVGDSKIVLIVGLVLHVKFFGTAVHAEMDVKDGVGEVFLQSMELFCSFDGRF